LGFIVKDGIIITPEGRNILRGISRDYVFEIAMQLGIECIEKNITEYDVYTADEAFMTGTPFSILPVTSLNKLKIGEHVLGPITKQLLDRWGENLGVDIIAQIKGYNQEIKENKDASSPYKFKSK
jgi:branched-chain amino acid aminotransferase